ncbi:tetratricopeptide repeat protein [Desulfurella sp.]|uniref:tetratricopeptide repeat protein n=1 Tax=Desulfurella sp. TaxID=1962857 RepID=UPI0025C6FEF0|nr:tetratricopeptide repeat protein [Desulfurella sp.]
MKRLIKKIEKYYKSKKDSLFFYPLACLLYENGAKEEAFDILIEGISKFPHYLLALIKIAQILMDEEKYEAAESYLETVLQINNANVLALELLADAYEKQGKIEQAIQTLEKLLTLNPSPKIKSKLLSLASLYTPSIEKVKEIVEQPPPQQLHEHEKTEISDIVIVDIENTNETSKEPLLEKEENTIDFEEIPTIDLEDDDQLNIAKLYVEQGYIEDAKNLYREILSRNPQNTQARQALEALDEKN